MDFNFNNKLATLAGKDDEETQNFWDGFWAKFNDRWFPMIDVLWNQVEGTAEPFWQEAHRREFAKGSGAWLEQVILDYVVGEADNA